MCFLKTLKPLDTIPIEKGHVPVDILPQEKFLNPTTNFSFSKKPQEPLIGFSLTKQDQLLLSLVQLMNSNTKLLQDVDKKLTYNDETLNNCFDSLNNVLEESSAFKQDSQTTQPYRETSSIDGDETATDPLVETLFGKKKYLYKLQLQGQVPTTIYKQRNINISVVLKNKQTQKVLNSNIIHLCLGVCDANGEWINQNKAKENFMKGKTEIEMYHGEGSFLKIYPREVSRTFTGGKLNFVVYAKASLLKFTNSSSTLQKIIDSDLIQPLVIKDIYVKAKKKE